MIRITDPAQIGPALGQVRDLLRLGQAELAQIIAEATGREAKSVANQIGQWERRGHSPTVSSLGPFLKALGYDLALVPVIETAPETSLSARLADETPSTGVHGRPRGAKKLSGGQGRCPACTHTVANHISSGCVVLDDKVRCYCLGAVI